MNNIITTGIQILGQLTSQIIRQRNEAKFFEERKKDSPLTLDPAINIDIPEPYLPDFQSSVIVKEIPHAQLPAAQTEIITTDNREENKSTATPTGCIPCMPPHELVWSNPGIKEISNLSVGQKVLDKDGKYTKILNVGTRPYTGDLISITVQGQNTPILLTPEHPVLAINAKKCKINHCRTVCFPKENPNCLNCQFANFKPIFIEAGKLNQHILLQPILQGEINNIVLNIREIANVNPNFTRKHLKKNIIVDNNFLKLAGLYLAEGSVSIQTRGAVLKFDFGSHEQKLVNETIELLYIVFGIKAKFRREANTSRIYVSSVILGHFFKNYFGNGANQKRIPPEILTLATTKQAILLYGYWLGDGCWGVSYKRNVLSATTISPNLAFGLRTILNRLGIIYSFRETKTRESKIDGRTIKGGTSQFIIQINSNGAAKLHKLWNIDKDYRFVQSSQSGIDDHWVYLPIKKLEKIHYEGPVMNIETESNTYCANGIIVHNCALGHVGTANNLMSEAIRFARKGGVADPEAIARYNAALDELNGMERMDMTPDMLIGLPPWEKEIAEKTLDFSRNTRHKIERLSSFEELENLAAEMNKHRQKLGQTWYRQKLAKLKQKENSLPPTTPSLENIEHSIDHDESTC